MPASIERKIGLAAWYNELYAPRFALAPHHYPIILGLEDPCIDNLFILGPPGTGKSVLLQNALATWELGHDPTLTILSVSAGEKLPQGFMSSTMQVIQHHPKWKEYFPDVRPAPDLGWSISRGLFVSGHPAEDPDASFISVGLQSKALTGLHARMHIYDDIHDRENANTTEGRATVRQTYYDTLMGRADPRGCRKVAAGRWWAEDDLYQEWIKGGDWVVLELPATRPGQHRLWYDVYVPQGLECVYTDRLGRDAVVEETPTSVHYKMYYAAIDESKKGFYWPASPTKRKEYETVRRRLPRVAAINYDGDMRGGAADIFMDSDFEPFVPPGDLAFGVASPVTAGWIKASRGEVEQAWDTALGQVASESLTVALTALLVPCQQWHRGEDPEAVGACDFHFDVLLLDAMVKNIDFKELMMALRTQNALWHPRMVTVEEKQSGISLLQTFKGSGVPLRGQSVAQGKVERAVNPIMSDGQPIPGGPASVQGWGRMGRIRYPLGAHWVEKGPGDDPEKGFIKRVMAFKGGSRGSDEFDALVHMVTRAILKSRKIGRFAASAPVDDAVAANALAAAGDPRRQVIDVLGMMLDPVAAEEGNPYDGLCGAPCGFYSIVENREWCGLHGRVTNAFGGCGGFIRARKQAA